MNNNFHHIVVGVLLAATFTACNKDIEVMHPGPQDPADSTAFVQFEMHGIPLSNSPLHALLSIEDEGAQPVITNKKIPLVYVQGRYVTGKLSIDTGAYALSKFIVVNSSDTAAYASPKANASKAPEVRNPLNLRLYVVSKGVTKKSIDVLRIDQDDRPEDFGYSSVDFGYLPYMTLRVVMQMQVGSAMYDSLPGDLTVNASKDGGETWTRQFTIVKGQDALRVPQNYSVYTFEANKWNKQIKKVYAKTELQNNQTVLLEGVGNFKRLTKEASFIENAIAIIPESRTEYHYDGNRLALIKNYQKSLQVSGLNLTNVYTFQYKDGRVDTIYRYDAHHQLTGYSAFSYSGQDINGISNTSYDQQVHAVFEHYRGSPHHIIGEYLFGNGHTMVYQMQFVGGNKISETAQTSAGSMESASFDYDSNINPYYHLGYPDLYFSNSSKNNITAQARGYSGAVPSVVPYRYEFAYDAEGYPVTVYISYKGGTSQQHLYRIKKEFSYE
jgi:hypothetical protein